MFEGPFLGTSDRTRPWFGPWIPCSNSKLKKSGFEIFKKRLEATNWAENKAYRFDVDSRDDPVISPDPFDSKNNHGSQLHNEKTNR